ncbi:hypothetical protein KW801_02130 [Candidatus Saccharibacteria bacterium]|nr:hypothetical protein [Candidatus Saccharibacteria bacterium]
MGRIELETKPAEITWLGRLDGGVANKNIWSGKIPASEYQLPNQKATEYKRVINNYYVKANPSSSVRCIDGRPNEGILDQNGQANPQAQLTHERLLGPQVPGGTPAAALSYRIANFGYRPELRTPTIITDMVELYKVYQDLGLPFRIGAHEDDHAHYPNTGCGAIDNLPAIMDRIVEPTALPEVKRLTGALLDEDFDESIFDETVARFRHLNQPDHKKLYLQQDDETKTDYKDIVIELVKKEADEDPSAVEKKVGAHKEFKVIRNKRHGETFDPDQMSLAHNNEAQIFNYDAWFVEDAANGFFPDDELKQKLYITSRTVYFIATAMVLTTGELETGSRE